MLHLHYSAEPACRLLLIQPSFCFPVTVHATRIGKVSVGPLVYIGVSEKLKGMKMAPSRNFWVVSPNVRFNRITEPKWTDATIRLRSAFMGWGSEDKAHSGIGFKFAHLIQPGDVILVARRFHKQPDLVGVGVVVGPFEAYREPGYSAKIRITSAAATV